MLVRNPFAASAAVVEIEHRCDRIDAQPVEAVALEPEQRTGDQEIGDFGSPVIVDQRSPVEVSPLARVGMLVERGAVELREAMRIVGEMARHPIENDAKPGTMAGVDQRRKIRRAAEPARRRELSGRLIAPGAVERMLGDRQELHMREVQVADIGRKLVRKLAIGEPAAAFLGPSPPGAEMHFIDRDRRIQGIAAGRRRRRGFIELHVDDNRRRLRAKLRRECDRVGLERQQLAPWADDLEFVLVSRTDARQKDFPEAIAAHAHGDAAVRPRN